MKVTDINELKTHVYVATETQSFTGDKLFNSIYRKEKPKAKINIRFCNSILLVGSLRAKAVLILIKQLLWISRLPKRQHRFMYVLPTSTEGFTRIYFVFMIC
jgi:lycopene beta-cyclase